MYKRQVLDCDFNRHLTNSRYPVYLDLGRWDIMVKSGALSLCVRKRYTPVVVDMNLSFRKELPFGTPFTLDTRIVAVEARVLVFEQLFLVDETVHCRAEIRSLVLHRGRVTWAEEFTPFIHPQRTE